MRPYPKQLRDDALGFVVAMKQMSRYLLESTNFIPVEFRWVMKVSVAFLLVWVALQSGCDWGGGNKQSEFIYMGHVTALTLNGDTLQPPFPGLKVYFGTNIDSSELALTGAWWNFPSRSEGWYIVSAIMPGYSFGYSQVDYDKSVGYPRDSANLEIFELPTSAPSMDSVVYDSLFNRYFFYATLTPQQHERAGFIVQDSNHISYLSTTAYPQRYDPSTHVWMASYPDNRYFAARKPDSNFTVYAVSFNARTGILDAHGPLLSKLWVR